MWQNIVHCAFRRIREISRPNDIWEILLDCDEMLTSFSWSWWSILTSLYPERACPGKICVLCLASSKTRALPKLERRPWLSRRSTFCIQHRFVEKSPFLGQIRFIMPLSNVKALSRSLWPFVDICLLQFVFIWSCIVQGAADRGVHLEPSVRKAVWPFLFDPGVCPTYFEILQTCPKLPGSFCVLLTYLDVWPFRSSSISPSVLNCLHWSNWSSCYSFVMWCTAGYGPATEFLSIFLFLKEYFWLGRSK